MPTKSQQAQQNECLRSELLQCLENVAPAISNTTLIPALTNLWFGGGRVLAFNDQIAISSPLPAGIEISGGLPGKTLLEIIRTSRARKVSASLAADQYSVIIKMSNAKVTLPLMPESELAFAMPASSKAAELTVDKQAFLKAIKNCLRSVSSDTSVPDQLGVTIMAEKAGLSFFATDNATISHDLISSKSIPKFDRSILPQSFCKECIRLADPKSMTIEFHPDHVLMFSGSVDLFGRLIESENPLPFASLLEKHFPASARKSMMAVPEKFKPAIDRAVIIADAGSGSEEITSFKVTTEVGREQNRRVLRMHSKSEAGEVADLMIVDDAQPNVAARFEPHLFKPVGDFSHLLITERCAVMTDDANGLYLISASV